jgi:hypothetical protein
MEYIIKDLKRQNYTVVIIKIDGNEIKATCLEHDEAFAAAGFVWIDRLMSWVCDDLHIYEIAELPEHAKNGIIKYAEKNLIWC